MDLYSFYILGFMLGRPAIETSYLLWRQMEWYWELKKDLHMDFIDLEKTCDSISRGIMEGSTIEKSSGCLRASD
jgi:hypothetical protein